MHTAAIDAHMLDIVNTVKAEIAAEAEQLHQKQVLEDTKK